MDTRHIDSGDAYEFPSELRGLFARYRETLPDSDGTPAFMPGLWSKIDSRRRVAYSLGRLTGAFVTAAAAICLILSAGESLLLPNPLVVPTHSSYVDVLDASDGDNEQVELLLARSESL